MWLFYKASLNRSIDCSTVGLYCRAIHGYIWVYVPIGIIGSRWVWVQLSLVRLRYKKRTNTYTNPYSSTVSVLTEKSYKFPIFSYLNLIITHELEETNIGRGSDIAVYVYYTWENNSTKWTNYLFTKGLPMGSSTESMWSFFCAHSTTITVPPTVRSTVPYLKLHLAWPSAHGTFLQLIQ